VSHIKRSRTSRQSNPCDNFLYGFKGARLRLPPGGAEPRKGPGTEGAECRGTKA